MQEFKSIKNELPNEYSACMVKPFFGGELLSIYRGGKFHGCAYDFVIDKSAIESWSYFNSKTPQEDLNSGEGDVTPSHCCPSIFVYWNGPSDGKIMHGERLEYLGWHKDGERIGVKSYSGGVHFVARDHISAEPPAKQNLGPNTCPFMSAVAEGAAHEGIPMSRLFATSKGEDADSERFYGVIGKQQKKAIDGHLNDRLKAASEPVRHFAPISPGDELRELTDSILKKQVEDMERALYQVEYPELEYPFGKDDEPEFQNPTAVALRNMADLIESGKAEIIRSEYTTSQHMGKSTTSANVTIREENAQ